MKIIEELELLKCEEVAKSCLRYFKTQKGEYGENDLFLGIKVPILRKFVKKYYKEISLVEIDNLIKNKYHEIRFVAIAMLVSKYKENPIDSCKLYLSNIKYVNNWDLVDTSAQYIIGPSFYPNTEKLFELANSKHLWSERIAMIATFYNLRQNNFEATIKLSKHYLENEHDLIHKATGWMLREVGKRDEKVLLKFLDENYKNMPRVMLRYALEKTDDATRKNYLH